jgi:hypothetical protein
VKRFGKGLLATVRANDWFDWFTLGVFVFLGVVGGMVADVIGREFP